MEISSRNIIYFAVCDTIMNVLTHKAYSLYSLAIIIAWHIYFYFQNFHSWRDYDYVDHTLLVLWRVHLQGTERKTPESIQNVVYKPKFRKYLKLLGNILFFLNEVLLLIQLLDH